MISPVPSSSLDRLRAVLEVSDPKAGAASGLERLVRLGLDKLPMPGAGATIERWQALAVVAEHDLSLAKLYEGHTDALAIMMELGALPATADQGSWCVWAAESSQGRTTIEPLGEDRVLLHGTKFWCSGAGKASHAVLTAWHPDDRGPQLVRVSLRQPGVTVIADEWHAVGMAGSASLDVQFRGAPGHLIGGVGEYLSRPGFWQGGAGIAACWLGGARGLAVTLRQAPPLAAEPVGRTLRLCALGKVDVALETAAAILRETARWIDEHPSEDASRVALRARLVAEDTARRVLDEVGRALGATPFCRDARFAQAAADLPVFIRQSHADRDCVALGERLLSSNEDLWKL